MARHGKSKTALSALASIPNFLEAQDEVFSSARDLQMSLRYLNRVLSTLETKSDVDYSSSFLINKIEVEFSQKILVEEIRIDHARTRLVIRAPLKKSESRRSIETRRSEYLLRYSTILEELRMRALIVAYRALSKAARKQIVKTEQHLQRSRRRSE